MISISGTLDVRSIKGRNGIFQTGELTTAIGDFKVKDKVLEQFEPGSYTGTFLIDKIYPHSYVWYGKVTVEVRARLTDVQLDRDDPDADSLVADPIVPEPDPVDEESAAAPVAAVKQVANPDRLAAGDNASAASPALEAPPRTASASVDEPVDTGSAAPGAADEMLDLFGDELAMAIRNRDVVKLDPTVDRALFRKQCEWLNKRLDYSFRAASQTWHAKE